MNTGTEEFCQRVLALLAANDDHDSLWWTSGTNDSIRFSVKCSDVFWWGTADCEELTPENIGILEQSYKDVLAAAPDDCVAVCSAADLFCARVRKMRPQGCCYPENRALWPLFDACGPERPIDFNNPYPPGGKVRTQPLTSEEQRDKL